MTSAKAKVLESGISENAAESFLSELHNFDINEGTSMLKVMLSANSNELNEYLKAYEEKQIFADSSGASMFSNEMEVALNNSVQYMKAELQKAGFDIPETFFDAGKDSALKFGDAFASEIDVELNKIKDKIEGFKAKISVEVDVNNNGKGSQTVINNNDNRTTNISASYPSPRGFIESYRQLHKYQYHTAKWSD